MSSIVFTLLFKGFYFLLFLVLIIIYCSITPVFQSTSPCRLDTVVIYTLIGIVGTFVFASIFLIVLSIILRVPDVYGIRVEIIADCICLFTYIVSYAISLAVGLGIPANLVNTIGTSLYGISNIIITGTIPALRTFHKVEAADMDDLETWLQDDKLRTAFKQYCIKELAIENILFIEKCTEYKKLETRTENDVQTIVAQFLTSYSVNEINVNSRAISHVVRWQTGVHIFNNIGEQQELCT